MHARAPECVRVSRLRPRSKQGETRRRMKRMRMRCKTKDWRRLRKGRAAEETTMGIRMVKMQHRRRIAPERPTLASTRSPGRVRQRSPGMMLANYRALEWMTPMEAVAQKGVRQWCGSAVWGPAAPRSVAALWRRAEASQRLPRDGARVLCGRISRRGV